MTDTRLSVSFTNLHNDNWISILTYLTPPDILSIRKICKRLYDITHTRIVWINTCIKCIERGYPFPNVPLQSLSIAGLEKSSYCAHRLGQKWLSPDENLQPRFIWHNDSISSAAISDVRFVPGHDHKWLVTTSKSVWSVLALWDVQCCSAKLLARKSEWSPKGAVFKSLCINDDPTSEAILVIGLLHGGNEMLHVLGIADDGESISFHTVTSFSTNFTPITLHGDLTALSDERSQVTVWNWRTNEHATLCFEQEASNSWKHSGCSQVLFSQSTESILVVRDQSIYLFPFPELHATDKSPLTYTNYAHHHFGWINGISATLIPPLLNAGTITSDAHGEMCHSISVLLRRRNADPWSIDTHNVEHYILLSGPTCHPQDSATFPALPQNLPANIHEHSCKPPYLFPPILRTCIPDLRGSLSSLQRYSNIILGRTGTAVWINPQDRAAGGLLYSDDEYPSPGIPYIDRSNERLMAALFHGPLWRLKKEAGPIEKGIIWANDKNNWTALDYEEGTGRIALGSSSGELTVMVL